MIGISIIICPKCGHTNRALAMNCDHCHINLAWALENQGLFEVDGKQAELDLSNTPASASGEIEVDQQNPHGPLIFAIVIIITVLLNLRTDFLCTSAVLLLLAACFWFTESYERNQEKEVETIWSALAQQTGLTYVPSKRSFLSFISPRLFGKYRGRYVSMTLQIEGGGGEYDSPTVSTKIALQVMNRAGVSLEINEKWLLTRSARKRDILSGNPEFDRRFRVSGTPRDFAQRTIYMSALQNIFLLDESQSRIMKTAVALSWASYRRPTLTLKNGDLICLVQGVLTDVDVQTAMLNMLCDLADLADQI